MALFSQALTDDGVADRQRKQPEGKSKQNEVEHGSLPFSMGRSKPADRRMKIRKRWESQLLKIKRI
jgi:hypothetical protein